MSSCANGVSLAESRAALRLRMVHSEKGHSHETAQRDCGNKRENQLVSERHDVLRQHVEEAAVWFYKP